VIATQQPGALRKRRLDKAERTRGDPEPLSLQGRITALPPKARAKVLGAFTTLQLAMLAAAWRVRARPTQLAPSGGHWLIWLILCGRGWGKTRTGAEWVKERIDSGEGRSIGLIGPTLKDVWDTMVYGTADAPGFVRLFDHLPEDQRPEVKRNDRKILFRHPGADGTIVYIFTAEEPELRGPNLDTVWCDELAKWRYLKALWDNLEMTRRVRSATPSRILITTTPRPLQLILDLLDDPEVRVTFGSMYANASNLDPSFARRMRRLYEGTRTGLQELHGGVLNDNPDALWQASTIDAWRVESEPGLARVLVGVDPAVSENKRSDLTGIVVAGLGDDGELYVLADLTGVEFRRDAPGLQFRRLDKPKKHTPDEWGDLVIRCVQYFKAHGVVCEDNRAGSLVASNVRAAMFRKASKDGKNPELAAAAVKVIGAHATHGKAVRAEPVATLYEAGKVHHVGRDLAALESEMCEWNPVLTKQSPNRIDALVHCVTALAGLGSDEDAAGDYSTATVRGRMAAPVRGERFALADTADDDEDDGREDDEDGGGSRW
jgi:phage terminase large subunit-like protein